GEVFLVASRTPIGYDFLTLPPCFEHPPSPFAHPPDSEASHAHIPRVRVSVLRPGFAAVVLADWRLGEWRGFALGPHARPRGRGRGPAVAQVGHGCLPVGRTGTSGHV